MNEKELTQIKEMQIPAPKPGPCVKDKQEDVLEAVLEGIKDMEEVEEISLPEVSGLPHESRDDIETVQIPEEQEQIIPSVGLKEMKALKKARYNEIAEKYKTSFVLKKKKTGQIVEIRAASSFHACKIIGWKPTQVSVLEVSEVEEENVEA
jgi:hypothetical protein